MSAEEIAKAVLAKVGVWWPDADEGKVRAAADAWRRMAGSLDEVASVGDGGAALVQASHTGPAADAFGKFWQRYADSGGHLPNAATACREIGAGCDRFADAVATAKHRLIELAVEVGASIAVGTVLAVFTFGVSEAAAAAATASLVAAAGIVEGTFAAVLAEIVASAAVYAAVGALESAVIDVAVTQPIRVEGFRDGGYSAGEIATVSAGGALLGGAGGAVGRGIGLFRSGVPRGGARFGWTENFNYRETFFAEHPTARGTVVVHHAVEQQVLRRYPGLVSENELHSLPNLRGIPNELNNSVHLSDIRKAWNRFYKEHPSPTQQELLDQATSLDTMYGPQFNPPVK